MVNSDLRVLRKGDQKVLEVAHHAAYFINCIKNISNFAVNLGNVGQKDHRDQVTSKCYEYTGKGDS